MELLPKCPFCGKVPRQSFDGFEHRIECDGECPGHAQSHDISPESVLAAWSTRNGIPPAAPTEVPSRGVAGAAEGVRVGLGHERFVRMGIFIAWAMQELSEGQACKALGMGRADARAMLYDAKNAGISAYDTMKGGDK